MTDVSQDTAITYKPYPDGKWYAWLDTMPPGPNHLHVVGKVVVPNPGVYAVLRRAVPQGINPNILLLNLFLIQRPGVWPQVESCVEARYDEVVARPEDAPDQVQVLQDGAVVADIKVEIVS